MGCNTDPNTIEVATRLTTLNQKHTTLAKSLIAELTREPEAVRIRHLRGYKAANGHQIICGEANAKKTPMEATLATIHFGFALRVAR